MYTCRSLCTFRKLIDIKNNLMSCSIALLFSSIDLTLCRSTLRYVDRPYVMLIDPARLCDQSSHIKNIPPHSAAVSLINVTIWWTVTVTIKYIVVTTTYHIGTVVQYVLHMRYNHSPKIDHTLRLIISKNIFDDK